MVAARISLFDIHILLLTQPRFRIADRIRDRDSTNQPSIAHGAKLSVSDIAEMLAARGKG